MTEDKRRELFESEMKKSNKYAPSLMKWKNDRYEFDTTHAAYCGFCVALEAKQVEVKMPEPVAYLWQHSETGRTRIVMPDMVVTADANWIVVSPLYPEPQVRTMLSAAPTPPAQERKPLGPYGLKKVIDELSAQHESWNFGDLVKAVEIHHGIGAPQ